MACTSWTSEEELFLLENFYHMKLQEIADILERTRRSVQTKAIRLKLKKRVVRIWSRKEMNYLYEHHQVQTVHQIAKHLTRTDYSVHQKMKRMDLEKFYPNHINWSDEVLKFLHENHTNLSVDDFADMLKINKSSIHLKMQELNITSSTPNWTAEEDEKLINFYYSDERHMIPSSFEDRTESALVNRMKRLGLRVEVDILYNGECFDSLQERDVYAYLFENGVPILRNNQKWYNIAYEERYVPDFIIKGKHGDIIVEYYGLYVEDSTCEYIRAYKSKTHRKNKFYEGLEEEFLSIYRDDIRDNYKGLRDKLLKVSYL